MSATYDVFVSHAWTDGDRPQQIAEALKNVGLRVWFDAAEINDFSSISGSTGESIFLKRDGILARQPVLIS
jgi:hypothetical protein